MGFPDAGLPRHHQRHPAMTANGSNSFWTDERTAELKTRWRNGETGSQIQRAMGAASRNAVVGKVHRLGLDGRFAIQGKSSHINPNPLSITRRARARRRQLDHRGDDMADETDFKNPKRFIELGATHCRWPGEGVPGPDLLCCAAPTLGSYSYCAAHCAIAFAGSPQVKAPRR